MHPPDQTCLVFGIWVGCACGGVVGADEQPRRHVPPPQRVAHLERDWCCVAEQSAPAHPEGCDAHPEGCDALC